MTNFLIYVDIGCAKIVLKVRKAIDIAEDLIIFVNDPIPDHAPEVFIHCILIVCICRGPTTGNELP